ncbi:WYL domain-containing protein [Alicyclobacillus contaminans]|uniref:helix-turn-helix transcriptional regulator n=1 Tax=Alicyclobacillus contaminans TaxID=392016 RepID=UPI00040789DF|nr:transcriptional regulator [Alicyclobacillus contaminans]GMA49421.1 WYL domain-containing protein [Alicyclobacillus contaminans]
MPERQNVRHAGRLFDLVNLISKHPKVYTASKLAEHFHTSVRTIRRDIRLLEDIGIRVESEPIGGYFIMQDLSRVPMPLTESDRLALEIVPWLLRGSLFDGKVSSLIHAYQSAMDKVLGGRGRAEKQASEPEAPDPGVVVDLANVTDTADDGVVLEILSAIRNRRTLEIEYQKVGSAASETRQINPYYLVPWQNSLYVIGYCHLRHAFRTFKVARMQSVHSLADTFVRDTRFSLTDFLKSAWGIDQSGPEVKVKLAFDADVAGYAREDIRAHRVLGENTDPDGRYIVEVRVHLNAEFLRFVTQYGGAVEVMEPSELRQRIKEEAEKMLARYQKRAAAPERTFR